MFNGKRAVREISGTSVGRKRILYRTTTITSFTVYLDDVKGADNVIGVSAYLIDERLLESNVLQEDIYFPLNCAFFFQKGTYTFFHIFCYEAVAKFTDLKIKTIFVSSNTALAALMQEATASGALN